MVVFIYLLLSIYLLFIHVGVYSFPSNKFYCGGREDDRLWYCFLLALCSFQSNAFLCGAVVAAALPSVVSAGILGMAFPCVVSAGISLVLRNRGNPKI